jgi:fibronectin-binding autotransporter adhesin
MKKKPARILHAALTSVMLMAGASLQAQTVSVTYIGPTGLDNYWTVGSNWTGGVAPNNGQPTAETIYNATINNGNTVSVLYYTPITLNNLTLGNAGIAGGGVMVNGQLTLGNAAAVGNSQLATKTGITFGENITLNGNWLRNGTGAESAGANWDSGTLTFNNSTATNSANSTWNAKGGLYDSVSSGNVFSNEGTFIKSTVSTLTIEPTFNSNLGSTASVSEGELRLLGGGTHNGALNVSDAATLTLGGTHTISGSLSVSSLAAFNVSSGTTTVAVPYNHSGVSAISNGAALTFNGTGTHTGSFSNSGTLNFGGLRAPSPLLRNLPVPGLSISKVVPPPSTRPAGVLMDLSASRVARLRLVLAALSLEPAR